MARKVGRPKGSGGAQPNWQFTKARRGNIKKAQKVATAMRKKAGLAILTKTNVEKFRRYKPKKTKEK